MAAPITSRVMSFVFMRHCCALPSRHRHTSAILRASSARLRAQDVQTRRAVACVNWAARINWLLALCTACQRPPTLLSHFSCRCRSPTRSEEEPPLILRVWRAYADTSSADGYPRHLLEKVRPELEAIAGFRGLLLVTRQNGAEVEYVRRMTSAAVSARFPPPTRNRESAA